MKWIACILILLAFTGCSSSLRQGAIAPQCLTECQLSESRTEKVTVDFRHLEGAYPDEHIIGFKDVLGVYVADILGTREELPQVNYPSFRANGNAIRPFVGHPIDVEKDGTIRLPYIDPIDVDGMTLLEAKQAIRKAYSENKRMIEKGRDNIQVTLITPRTFRIHIFRQDTRYSVPGLQQQSQMEISRRWSGTSVFLEPKDASVLSALLKTGGLPGIDALNEIWVMKGVPPEEVDSIERDLDIPIKENLEGSFPIMLPKSDSRIVRIPLTHRIGEPLPFSAEDCLLGDGDVVFLPVRDGDTFLTGGLLPPGRFMLDRDRDVDVIEAITMAQGNVLDSIGSNSSSRFRGGVGGIVPPTDAIIVRRFNRDEQIKIHVDLTKAMNDPSERVVIKAGDLIVLRYKGKELMANALLNVFDFNVALTPLNSIID